VFVRAGALVDATGLALRPASLLLTRDEQSRAVGPFAWRVAALGGEGHASWSRLACGAATIELPHAVLGPGLVNAHTHLDLTALGPLSAEGGFAAWLSRVRRAREERLASDEAIARSAQLGAELSLRGGVVAVGDIAGRSEPAAVQALARSPLLGVAFLEAFGLADREEDGAQRALRTLEQLGGTTRRVGLGLQPHAPYSAGPGLFRSLARQALQRSLPLASHVAESADERRLLRDGEGPLRDLLEALGLWSDAVGRQLRTDGSPVALALEATDQAPRRLFAHCNDVNEQDALRLAEEGVFVAACPRSSLTLGHLSEEDGFGHLRLLGEAGVRLCVATDSVASLPPCSAERLSPLDDALLLLERGVFGPLELLEMLTLAPAEALGLAPQRFAFVPGEVVAGVAVATGVEPALLDRPVEAFLRGRALELLQPAD